MVARLVYERATGAETCPDERAVSDALRDRLGPTFLDSAATTTLRLRVSPRDSRQRGAGEGRQSSPRDVEGHIELLDKEGHRFWSNDLRASQADCSTLVSSLALSLRVAVSTLEQPHGAGAPATPAETPTIIRGVSLPPPYFPGPIPGYPGPLPQPPSPWRSPEAPAFRTQGTFGAVFGAAPSVAARVSLSLGFQWPWASIAVEARGTLPASGPVRIYELTISRWEGVFLPCLAAGVFFGCALLAAGGLWAETAGARRDTRALLHVSAGARAGLQLTITSNLGIAGFVDVEGSLLPTDIRIDNFALWQEQTAQVALGLALSWASPGVRQ